MRILFCSVLFFFLGLTVFAQDFTKQSLEQLLESTKTEPLIAVEGYYVDNSSFMVTRSTSSTISENKRYAVYEYKYQHRLYTKTPEGKVELAIFVKSGEQGQKRSRILFVNKERSNDSQLVVDEFASLGLPIVGDSIKYTTHMGDSTDLVSLDDLRDFLFNGGAMPQIEHSVNLEN